MNKQQEAIKLALEAADELEWILKSRYPQGREGPPRIHRLISKIKALADQPSNQLVDPPAKQDYIGVRGPFGSKAPPPPPRPPLPRLIIEGVKIVEPQQEPVALLDAIRAEPTVMIHKWRVIDLVREYTPQPSQQETQTQWHLSEEGLPPVGSEVIGGYFYKDLLLKSDYPTFGWGLCRVISDNHRDFPDGKRWSTFGPSHNQITHWCWPPKKPHGIQRIKK